MGAFQVSAGSSSCNHQIARIQVQAQHNQQAAAAAQLHQLFE